MSRSRCLLVASTVAVLLPASAHAQTPGPDRTIEATGVASVKVKAPIDRSISDTASSPYGPFFYGSFGPDRFCGTIRTTVFKRGKDGKRHRVGTRTRHTCRAPPTVTSTVSVTFAAT
jgi:hypothetical protein